MARKEPTTQLREKKEGRQKVFEVCLLNNVIKEEAGELIFNLDAYFLSNSDAGMLHLSISSYF